MDIEAGDDEPSVVWDDFGGGLDERVVLKWVEGAGDQDTLEDACGASGVVLASRPASTQ